MITSQSYDLRPDQALFRGGVVVRHPQTEIACEVLKVGLPPGGGRVDAIDAQGGVQFDMADNEGRRVKGSSDVASYRYAESAVQTNEQMELSGGAVVNHTNGVLRSPVIYFNRAENKLSAPNWTMRGKVPSDQTNIFRLPKGF